ncbi:MAG: substrate-binding domain-containing protein [Pseudomonadota bacterium]
MRLIYSFIVAIIVAACGAPANLSAIEEQADAPPVYSIGETQKIKIVGSSTVAPFATTVAEQFGASSEHAAPIVETTGTGGGFKIFCDGIGPDEASIVNASRKIKSSELDLCREVGILDPLEVKIGYDGIVFANSKSGPDFNLTKAQIFLALAANLPDGNGGWIKNPYRTWQDVDPSLPATRILVSGPPPTSGTRDAFAEIAMENGALALPEMQALKEADTAAFTARAREVRNDGAWIDSGENDSSIINTLLRNDDAVGVLGYSFLEQNLDRVKAAKVGGVEPTFENIASNAYGVSRSMYFYVKTENTMLVPGLADYVTEFTQEDAWGPDGYLVAKGLIPLLPDDRAMVRDAALARLTGSKNPLPSEHDPSPPQSDEAPPG